MARSTVRIDLAEVQGGDQACSPGPQKEPEQAFSTVLVHPPHQRRIAEVENPSPSQVLRADVLG